MAKFSTRLNLTDQNFIQQTGDTFTFNGKNIFNKPLSGATFTFVGTTPQILTKTRLIVSGVTNPSFRGVEYGSNYKTNFLKRSIPDVDYVTGLTASLGGSNIITGATNGLTKTGKKILLGGLLTTNTDIDITSRSLSFVDSINSAGIVIDGETPQGNISILHSLVGTLEFKNTGAIFTDVRVKKRGIQYNADYSSDFTARSLVDAHFVTGITSQINPDGLSGTTNLNGLSDVVIFAPTNGQTIIYSGGTWYNKSVITGTVTGGTNGLNVRGRNVRLGGKLTGATTIGLVTNNLTFTGTTGHLKYGSNLSSNFNARSLVDAGYVTGITSQLVGGTTNVEIANTTFTATTATKFIGVSGSTSLIYLPAAPTLGQIIFIKDIVGDANSNSITVNGNGKNIDGSSTALINTDYGSITMIWYGKEWSIVGYI